MRLVVGAWLLAACGRLGFDSQGASPAPDAGADAAAIGRWQAVTSSNQAVCAIASDQALWCWGYSGYGELGIAGPDRHVPTLIATSTAAITLGYASTCAIKDDGSAWCWGMNGGGQLGDGTNVDHGVPVRIP